MKCTVCGVDLTCEGHLRSCFYFRDVRPDDRAEDICPLCGVDLSRAGHDRLCEETTDAYDLMSDEERALYLAYLLAGDLDEEEYE